MQAQQENIRDGNFYFLKYGISLSKSSIDTIGEIRVGWKVTLNVFSHTLSTLFFFFTYDLAED